MLPSFSSSKKKLKLNYPERFCSFSVSFPDDDDILCNRDVNALCSGPHFIISPLCPVNTSSSVGENGKTGCSRDIFESIQKMSMGKTTKILMPSQPSSRFFAPGPQNRVLGNHPLYFTL